MRALASGLRVQSAADDPSGLAISQSLQSKVNGLQQSVQNVQTGNNLLAVADSALASVQKILQRIRSLAVEARSDINSNTQLQSIQSEIDQLLHEINTISTNTNFNGLRLLDGSFAQSNAASSTNLSSYGGQQINAFVLAPGGGNGSSSIANGPWTDGNSPPLTTSQFVSLAGNGVSAPNSYVPADIVFQVIGYDAVNAVDPVSGPIGGPGLYVQFTAYNYTHNPAFGNGDLTSFVAALPVGSTANESTPISVVTPQANASGGGGGGATLQELLNFYLGPLSPQDVGVTQAFRTIVPQAATNTNSHALNINDGGQEGSTVGLYLPQVDENALGLTGISVLTPTTVDYNTNDPTGSSSSNLFTAGDAEQRVDAALQSISLSRAQIGAQSVSLNYDSNNDSITSVNLTASISSITDASIGQFTTDFTKNQILTQVGQQVISSTEISAKQLSAILFTGSSVA